MTEAGKWDEQAFDDLGKVERYLYGWPDFTRTFVVEVPAAEGERPHWTTVIHPPWAWVACPKGHPIIKLQLYVDHNWHLRLTAASEDASEDAEVPASEQRAFDARMPEPSGPRTNPRRAEPDVGGTTAENKIDAPRVTLTCSSCDYTGTHRQSRLLVAFAATVTGHGRTLRLRS